MLFFGAVCVWIVEQAGIIVPCKYVIRRIKGYDPLHAINALKHFLIVISKILSSDWLTTITFFVFARITHTIFLYKLSHLFYTNEITLCVTTRREAIKEHFDNKRWLVQRHVRALFEISSVYKENHSTIHELLNTFLKYLRVFKAFKRLTTRMT